MASSSSSSSRSFTYDVFLSFRGEDTRKTFVDHLHDAFKRNLIITYKDDETLSRGESIGPSLFKGIEDSRIAVVVFSKNYAGSSWCLEELAHIMKCKEERELIVMPIFYDVDPSDVRKQKEDFGKAFDQLDVDNNKAQLWRNALVDASNIAGWEPKHIANGHESKVIKEIVDKVRGRLFTSNADVDEDLVGIETRLEDLKSKLEAGSEGVRMVGIWGCGGSGKTTLATSIYMELRHHFQGHCIMENIREESSKFGLKKLQENMLSAIFKNEVAVPNVVEGKQNIKTMLCSRNVLIILDDVDDLDQLDVLAGSHSWFGSGSRIIITTRDEHLLTTHKVDVVCHVKLLSCEEAMQLFNKHAYNEKKPVEDYETLSSRVVSYADGLPLALKVLGSFLYDKDKKGWISALDRLKDNPNLKIVEKLKISYDGLETVEKELFLDIACFFRGRYKGNAVEILEACGFHPEIGIEALRQKALITVSRDGNFDMHDLVQEMGHFIVKGEHPNSPDKHSRIWKHEEIDNMHLTMENDRIEAIRYKNFNHDLDSSQFCKSVSNMKKLRYLKVSLRYPKLVEGPTFLSNELRYIDWKGYPGKSPFPDIFQPKKLVNLELGNSFQKHVWKGYKHLPHLKVLRLPGMKKLLRTPDFDGLPCLQELTLFYCSELKEIHPSLGNHKSLQSVQVSRCHNLRTFPAIVHMENLQTLEIEDCEKLLEFPKIQANMEALVKLSVEDTGIQVLPSSIGERCTNLISLNLSQLKNLKSIEFNFDALKHLKTLQLYRSIHVKTMFHPLDLYTCCFKDVVEIPPSITELSNLQELDLSSSDFSRLDFSLSRLTRLKHLDVSCCKKLVELPELPSSLTILNARYCESLTTFGDCHKNCEEARLCQVSLWDAGIISDGQELLESILEACMAVENHCMVLQLTGAEIAKGFTPPLLRGNRCTLQLSENWCNDFSGFLICAVLPSFHPSDSGVYRSINVYEEMNGMDSQHDDEIWKLESYGKYTLMAYVSFGSLRRTVWWDQTHKALSFEIADKRRGCGFGIRLIDKKKSRSDSTETSTIYSSAHTPTLRIVRDSMSAVRIYLPELLF
ncbi:TMV resistance protein N-like [Bidens hawaiensis]|uniref:TMV resistance protein N-like n=1 Tax=Bidens hawaiensis TaxID=980011 RepID=UPI004049B068